MRWEIRTRSLLAQGAFYMAIGLVVAAVNGEPEKAKPRPSKIERIPDPTYQVKRGDRAMLFGYYAEGDQVWTPVGMRTSFGYNEYYRALDVRDDDGMNGMIKEGTAVRITPKTGVLVLELEAFPVEDPRVDAAIVRITDGPLKGQKFWVAQSEACRLMENPAYEPPAVVETPKEEGETDEAEWKRIKEGARSQMAESYLNIAENLRKSKKYTQARKTYLEVIRDFSDHPEAKTAKARLKTLPKN